MRSARTLGATAAAAVLTLTTAGAAHAQVVTFPLPAGAACDFPLTITYEPAVYNEHEFTTGNGITGVIRSGLGQDITFTNEGTGESLTVPARGYHELEQTSEDGTVTLTVSGTSILSLFPSDVPAGPSTNVYFGRLVFTIAPDGTYTLLSQRGTRTDICAALS
jgi:hypothetical protein